MLNENVQAPEDSHYLYVGVGDRATWKDPNCIFRTHKDTQDDMEVLRKPEEGSASPSASPLLDASREESCLNTDTIEEIEEPTPPRQPPPSTPPPSKPSPSPPVILKKPVRMLNGDPVFVKRK